MIPFARLRELLRRLTYLLGYQNLEHLTLLLESRVRKVDEFFVVRLGNATPPADFVQRHRGKVRELAMDASVTHIDLLCADDVAHFDFESVRPSIVHVTSATPSCIALLHRYDYDVMVRADDLVAHRRNRLAI